MEIRAIEAVDLEAVLTLNQGALDAVGPLNAERLASIVGLDGRALVAVDDGVVAGFVITVAAGTSYDSPNYRWFEQRYDVHTYLDRVVIHSAYRRTGLGSQLYGDIEAHAIGPVTLEVYAVPPNEGSLAFHAARGYVEVGRLPQAGGKIAAMFAK